MQIKRSYWFEIINQAPSSQDVEPDQLRTLDEFWKNSYYFKIDRLERIAHWTDINTHTHIHSYIQ